MRPYRDQCFRNTRQWPPFISIISQDPCFTMTSSQEQPVQSSSSDDQDDLPLYITIHGIPIYFGEDWTTGIGGGLWSTGKALAQYANTPHAQGQLRQLVQRRKRRNNHPLTILELGSGNGLLAACWLALCQSIDCPVHVYVTDTADHLPLIQQTMDANPHLWKNNNNTQVFVREHTWGDFANIHDPESSSWPDSFDIILGSDVAYHERLYRPLLASLDRFMPPPANNDNNKHHHPSTLLLLGCTMNDTTPEFFDLLQDTGFRYQLLQHDLLPAELQGNVFGVFLVQRRRRK